jgi:hypothetical protein
MVYQPGSMGVLEYWIIVEEKSAGQHYSITPTLQQL